MKKQKHLTQRELVIAMMGGEYKSIVDINNELKNLFNINMAPESVLRRVYRLIENERRITVKRKRIKNESTLYSISHIKDGFFDSPECIGQCENKSIRSMNLLYSGQFSTDELISCNFLNKFNHAINSIRGSAAL